MQRLRPFSRRSLVYSFHVPSSPAYQSFTGLNMATPGDLYWSAVALSERTIDRFNISFVRLPTFADRFNQNQPAHSPCKANIS